MIDLSNVKTDVSVSSTSDLKGVSETFGEDLKNSVISSQAKIETFKSLEDEERKRAVTMAYVNQKEVEHKAKVDEAIINTSKSNQQIEKHVQETNQQLIAVNRGLEVVNENLSKQLQEINSNMDFIINTIGANTQISEGQQKENQKLLIELIILLKTKDETGFKAFIENNIGNGIGIAGLILQAMSMV